MLSLKKIFRSRIPFANDGVLACDDIYEQDLSAIEVNVRTIIERDVDQRAMPENEELNSIIQKCLEGKEAGFKSIYYRFYDFLFLLARRYARDDDEAKDLVQQAFVRICKNIASFKQDGSFKSWSKRILINEAINHYRRVNHSNNMAYSEDMTYYEYDASMQISEQTVLSKLSYDELYEFVLELPPAYKTVFTLYVIDGYKHQEIADMLNIAISTSKSNLSRAKVLLAKRLESVGIGLKKRLIDYA